LIIVGLPTAQPFHLRVMDDPEFRRGEVDITYLERVGQRVLAAPPLAGLERAIAVTAALLGDERRARSDPASDRPRPLGSPLGTAWAEQGRREGLRE
jgi:acetyl/propionyl-CoA carboxylase alpha subunit